MKISVYFLFMVFFIMNTNLLSGQEVRSGNIKYSMESLAEIQMGSQVVNQTLELRIELDFFDENYRIGAIISGGMFQSDEPLYKYFVPGEKKLYIMIQDGSHIQVVPESTPDFTHFTHTGMRETFAGFTLLEFTANYKNQKAIGWYCPDLPPGISPVGYLKIPGTLMKLETENTKISVLSIDTLRSIERDQLVLPDKAKKK